MDREVRCSPLWALCVIEVLPALPEPLRKGWDMDARTVELRVTSARKQDVTLVARHGIEAITASASVLAAPLRAGGADIDVRLERDRERREDYGL